MGIQEFFLTTCDNVLNEEQRQFLNEEITISELDLIITSYNSNRSPGPDGLSANFYKKC